MQHWDRYQIQQYSVVTNSDIQAAMELWNSYYRKWPNTDLGKDLQLKAILVAMSLSMQNVGFAYVDGGQTLYQTRTLLKNNIITVNTLSGIFGAGSEGEMGREERALLATVIGAELTFLNRFMRQITEGTQAKDGNISRRAGMYGRAGWSTKETLKEDHYVRKEGAIYVKNRLGYADHCAGCLEETAKGLQPVGLISLPGTRDCRSNCFCTLEYYKKIDTPLTT